MYYCLQKHCILVEGNARGAIYNLASGRVHSINRGAVEFLQACRATAVEQLLDINREDSKPFWVFLDCLTAKGLGAFYTAPPAGQQTVAGDYQPQLEFVWLELTAACNNRCLHCYSASSPETPAGCVPHNRWLELIGEARQAGAYALQLIGGEPLLYAKWRELVIKARQENYDMVEIFTNATLLDDAGIAFCKQHAVSLATTLYAGTAAIHDKVTGNPGSFDQTITAINKILASQIPLRIASILMKANEQEADNIMKLCTQLGIDADPPDIVRPAGRGDNRDLLPSAYTRATVKPPFYTDSESFAKAQKFHNCLAGRLAITATGDVIPCIFARRQICGNITATPLSTILNSLPLKTCWETTKDYITKCRDCEYRYACPDCRPSAQNLDPATCWTAAPADCAYNPYTGKWEDEASCLTTIDTPNGIPRK